MAQLERTRRSTDAQKTLAVQTSPTFEQLLRVDEAYWSPTTSPRSGANHSHEEESSSPPQNRKSVIAKVRERAKKLRHSLSGRKNIHENDLNDDSTTPPWSFAFDDYNDDSTDDPEYLGAPMYESEAAPEGLIENARQHPRAVPVISESHHTPIRTKPSEPPLEQQKPITDKPAESPDIISSKISGLSITHDTARTSNRAMMGKSSPQTWDKGVSIKEYLASNVGPEEDERALSRAIAEATSPKKIGGNTGGVVEKVKEAVASFFWNEEPSNSMARPACPVRLTHSHSSRTYYSDTASSAPRLPLSSNARAAAEEENHGKILQTN